MHFDWSRVLKPSGDPARSERLMEFEGRIGFDLPDDYRNFLLKFNGGRVVVEHDIRTPDIPFDLGVDYLFPLSAQSPALGIIQARDMQVSNRLCLRQGLATGHDGGTGDYYLILAGEK